jgi:hypothetical protein
MLELENRKNPFENKRLSIAGFSSHAIDFVKRSDSVSMMADQFTAKGLKSAAALHLACACEGNADFFITTDDKLLKFQSNIQIIDPIVFIKILEHGRTIMTESVLLKTGMQFLIEKFGHVEAERFVSLLLREPFDYTKWREENLFVDMTVEEINAEAERFGL